MRPSKGLFVMVGVEVVAILMAMTLPRLWAARHSAVGDRFETLADAITVAV